jgi:peptide/nickel transport system permease protein
MLPRILRRLGQGLFVLLLVTVFTFVLVHLAPGGPSSVMRLGSTAAERAALRHQLGLDKPLPVQYLIWIGGVLHGNFGASLTGGEPVGPLIAQRLWNTVKLGVSVFAMILVFGTLFGVLAALRRNSWLDFLVNLASTLGMSIPDFWLGIMSILLFAVELHWFPASSTIDTSSTGVFQLVPYLVLPVGVLTFAVIPNIVRYARAAMLEAMSADYVRTARSKGLRQSTIVLKHAFKNALISVVSMLGLLLPVLLSGAVITESVFGWPGIGRLAVEAAMNRNYPVIMGVTVVAGAIVILTNIVVDTLYILIDPRIAHG